MKVLSLFDGISCGMLASERAGFHVEQYDAYEIDPYAITVSKKNYPQIVRHGDVSSADFSMFRGYDIVMGGFPCQDLSVAGSRAGLEGSRSSLFWELVRAIKEVQPKYFLVENNFGMPKDAEKIITETLGVEPIMINSSLMSAQMRKRLYWTNIPNVTQPMDKGILLKDVLEDGLPYQDKAYCLTKVYGKASFFADHNKARRSMVAVPLNTANGKSQTIKEQYGKTSLANVVRTGSMGATMIAEPVRIGNVGKTTAQANRVYSVVGKSVTLKANGGGMGAKTGLYMIDLPDGDYYIRKLTPMECERLQTVPDRYTEGISDTRRYQCLGNGWTVDVIAHILKGMK